MASHDPLDNHEFLTREELENFRAMLYIERDKLLEKSEQMVKAGNIELDKNEMLDEVDLASATTEQNLTFKLLDRDRKLLGEIEHALEKIKTGEYGYCEETGDRIGVGRLIARPIATLSIDSQERHEKDERTHVDFRV